MTGRVDPRPHSALTRQPVSLARGGEAAIENSQPLELEERNKR